MEFIFEFIFELIFEGGLEVTSNKKVSKWIRYPILAIIILFFALVIFGLIFVGIASLKNSLIGGIFIIAIGLFFLVASIVKFRQFYLHEKENLNTKQQENDK